MEVCNCTSRIFPNLPQNTLFTQTQAQAHLHWKTSLPLKQLSVSRLHSGLRYNCDSKFKSLRSKVSEDTSVETGKEYNEESVEAQFVERNDFVKPESVEKDFSVDEQAKPFEFIDNFNLEFDFEKDSYLILLYGGGSLIALWLAAAVVGSIDSIPLFPKLMEVVGLSYTFWFTTRYLLFKKNRDELFVKIEEIKREIIGSGDD